MRGRNGRRYSIHTLIFDPRIVLRPGADAVLRELWRKKYAFKLVGVLEDALTASDYVAELQYYGLSDFFQETDCHFVRDAIKFGVLYRATHNADFHQVAIVDDCVHEGQALHWAYVHGSLTIRVRQGKYMNEPLPPERTPDFTIGSLDELISILQGMRLEKCM